MMRLRRVRGVRYVRRPRGKEFGRQGMQRVKPGDEITIESIRELGNPGLDGFEVLDADEAIPGEEEPPEDQPDAGGISKLKAVHKGAGRYVVQNEDTGAQINEGYLTKADAEALVEGSVTGPLEEPSNEWKPEDNDE